MIAKGNRRGGANGTDNIYFLTYNSIVGWFNGSGVFNAFGGMIAPNITLTTAQLTPQLSPPNTCGSSLQGNLAMITNNGLCFCNGSAWHKVESPVTACSW